MKREVYEAIGGLDERFGLGFFDDDDLAERARRAGFELAVAHDLFVHHFGSRTFVGNGIDAGKLLDENSAKFAAKWGDAVPRGTRVRLKPFSRPAGETASRRGRRIKQRKTFGPSDRLARGDSRHAKLDRRCGRSMAERRSRFTHHDCERRAIICRPASIP